MKKQGTEIVDCSSAIDELLDNMTSVLANLSRRAGIEVREHTVFFSGLFYSQYSIIIPMENSNFFSQSTGKVSQLKVTIKKKFNKKF